MPAEETDESGLKVITRRVDDFQRNQPAVGFVHGVIKKFGDDRGSQQAALLTYYGFFSLFPLLLVAFTVLGYVLSGNDELRNDIGDTISEQLPLGIDVGQIKGSGFALVIGVVLALWSGLGATQVAQDAMNLIWDVPRVEQPNFFVKRLRGLATLAVIGIGVVAATAAGSVASMLGSGARIAAFGGAFVVNGIVVAGLFQLLTEKRLTRSAILPGAVVVGVGWTILQSLGSWYTQRLIDSADKTYGTFAVVIGLLSWIYLLSQVFVYGAEVSTVLERRLWPRAIDRDRPTEADEDVADAKAESHALADT